MSVSMNQGVESLSGLPEVNPWRPRTFGLFANKIFQGSCMGFVWSRAASYPFFGVYLNMDGHRYNSIRAVLMVVWAVKLVASVFTDSVPIFGRRRIPYMAIGWSLAIFGYFAAALQPYPEPYYGVSNCTRDTSTIVNPGAADDGAMYILWLSAALFGVGVTDVASDALAVEYSRREPVERRGRLMAWAHIFNWGGGLLMILPIGVGLNSVKYGGSICEEIFTFRGVIVCFCVFSICGLLSSLLITHDERTKVRLPIMSQLRGMWRTMKSSAFLQIAFYFIIEVPLSDVKSSATVKIKKNFARIEPAVGGAVAVLNVCLVMFIMWAYSRWFLHRNWRTLAIGVKIPAIVIALSVELLTIFDVVRNQYFYIIAEESCCFVFIAVLNYLMILLATEICDESQEGMTFGLLMSIWTIGAPLSTALGNMVSAPFDVSGESRYLSDTDGDRVAVASAVCLCYACNALSVLAIYFLLPAQKEQVQRMKKEATHRTRNGVLLVGVLTTLFLAAIGLNLLSSHPATQCLPLAGGSGC